MEWFDEDEEWSSLKRESKPDTKDEDEDRSGGYFLDEDEEELRRDPHWGVPYDEIYREFSNYDVQEE